MPLEKKEYYTFYIPEFVQQELFICDKSIYCVDITQESELCNGKSSASLNLETSPPSPPTSNVQRDGTGGSRHFYTLEHLNEGIWTRDVTGIHYVSNNEHQKLS